MIIKNRPNALHKHFGTDCMGTQNKKRPVDGNVTMDQLADILLIIGPCFASLTSE